MYKIYLVGGAVRDELLGLPVRERDWVVVGATPQDLQTLGFRQVGRDFPVFLHPKTHEEYALARTERKIAPGHTGFICHSAPDVTLEQDLLRRDLTINAIAKNTVTCELIDPYGGISDLKHRILRHVSPAFNEDPLRVLRVARFNARFAEFNFTIAPETINLMKTMVANHALQDLSVERVWQEMVKALATFAPDCFIITLHHCDALMVLFPEIATLFSLDTPLPNKNRVEHLLSALRMSAHKNLSLESRFAILCYFTALANKTEMLDLYQRYKVPRTFKELSIAVYRLLAAILTKDFLPTENLLQLLEQSDAFRRGERLEQILATCEILACHMPKELTVKLILEQIAAGFAAAKTVSVESLIATGLTGAKLGKALRQARLEAVKKT